MEEINEKLIQTCENLMSWLHKQLWGIDLFFFWKLMNCYISA